MIFGRLKMSGAIDTYKKNWDEKSQNPFTVTLSSGSATLSSSVVVQDYPQLWEEFKIWIKEKKTSEPLGEKSERVVLLYSAHRPDTIKLKENVALHIATKCNLFVLTAPYIYEKNTGKKIAFQQYPKETLNDFIKRMLYESQFVVILYTEQGGQIIETSWCSDSLKPTLGLVPFSEFQEESANQVCKFLKLSSELFECGCKRGDESNGKVGGYICYEKLCPFTKQKLTKMIFDFYIMNPRMYLFGATKWDMLQKPIDDFLTSKGFKA